MFLIKSFLEYKIRLKHRITFRALYYFSSLRVRLFNLKSSCAGCSCLRSHLVSVTAWVEEITFPSLTSSTMVTTLRVVEVEVLVEDCAV